MLALTSTLVLVLFDEARAVDVAVAVPTDVRTSDGTAVVSINIAIPAGQLVPIESLEAILEQTNGAVYASPSLIATATCAGASGCTSPDTTGSTIPGAIVAIEADGGNVGVSAGYLDVGNGVVATDLAELAGYGYGYGYGYGGPSGGTMEFEITLDVEETGAGHFWVTFIIHTRSTTIGDISSDEAYLRVSNGAAVVGGGTPPANPSTGAPPPGVSIAPGIVEHRADGSTLAETTVPPGLSGNPSIDLSSVDERLETLTIDSAAAPPGAVVTVQVSSTPPANMPPLDEKWQAGTLFLEISIELPDGVERPSGDSAPRAQIAFRVNEGDMGNRSVSTVTLLHFRGGQWVAEETSLAFSVGGLHVYTSSFRGFSPFAVVFDEIAPTVSITGPSAGATTGVRPLVAATLADNRAIDAKATTLTIDGQKVAATVSANTLRFTPSVPLTPGEHTAVVRAVDASGLETVATTRFTVRPGGDPTAPVVKIERPLADALLNSARPEIRATLSDDKGIDAASVVVLLDGLSVPVKATNGAISFAPDADLADGVHEIAVSADDANGNGGYAVTTFTIDTQAPLVSLTDKSPIDSQGRYEGVLVLTAAVSDASDVTSLTATVDGVAVEAERDGDTWLIRHDLAPGAHQVEVRVVDAAGNVAEDSMTLQSLGATSIPPASTEEPGAPADVPGFGLVLGVLALAAVALLARRKA